MVDQASLFAFDDVSIPFKQNLKLQMFQPTKHPDNPVLQRGTKGQPDEYRAQFYGSVIRHGGKFKMWYVAADMEALDALTTRSFYGWRPAYAESEDGIHWTKPNLGLVDYRGSRKNNLVLIDPPEVMGLHLVVLHEPEEPDPSRHFKMMLTVRTYFSGEKASTSVPLFSADGLRWHLAIDARPENYAIPSQKLTLPLEAFEQSGLFRWQGMYHLTGQQLPPVAWLPDGQPGGRVMTVLRSKDFVHWSATKSLSFVRYGYRSTASGQGEEAHLPASIWNRGNVLLGIYGLWHGAAQAHDRRLDLGLLLSNDGIHFREAIPDFVFVPSGKAGSWDAHGLLQGQGFENVGEETYIWYGNWDLSNRKVTEMSSQVGLVTLKHDRFGCLLVQHPSKPANLISCPLRVTQPVRLSINAEGLSEHARLRVELLDQDENLLSDYTGERSLQVRESGLRRPIEWRGKKRIEGLNAPFRIKVNFEGKENHAIRVFAFYLDG